MPLQTFIFELVFRFGRVGRHFELQRARYANEVNLAANFQSLIYEGYKSVIR